MNKPAAKEPSMDEILSSIRQIIADEDQEPETAAAQEPAADEPDSAEDDQDEPLALSPQQMITEPEAPVAEPEANPEDDDPLESMSMADDVAFDIPGEAGDADADVESLASMLADSAKDAAEPEPEPEIVLGDDIAFDSEDEPQDAEPVMAQAAPMPDPDLSRDIADKLLEPTTTAASKHAFSKLSQLSMGSGDQTIESMVRDMLRPMLKEWLDENLPGVVEKLVEREIERISRGS